ncbi:carbon-nitrogen family hydrolase [Staphylococcus schleiferi subsp. coagulans]|uniref:carbon-nitrogen family hydrolase n=1 Tax=Staphylococcus coagulans TaxID=74706 RepID=UPI0015FE4753|nr:carbon-nitrogen family hydrolase [Staphylococcus coagulans]MBA8760407.1 carbon-nitrogen family hydrolase [Staphylococcus coagulans]MBA8769213.1 carbon-nitrogen family hydrolase [Staphylococcus coagulans]
MQIQLFQFNVVPADAKKNQEKIASLFDKHVKHNTDVVVLPEMWNNGYALSELQTKADNEFTQSYPFIKKLAQQYQVDIIAGSVSNKKNDAVFNTAFAVNQAGDKIYEYDKIHLVPMLDEPDYLTDGQDVPYVYTLTDGTKVSQIICYDLRFPELSRYPAATGANIIFYVAQWPDVRLSHWRQLLQARAVENDMYVVAVNGSGNDGKTTYAGHSMVIDPNGQIIEEADAQEAVLTVELDLKLVTEQRKAIPVFDNIRPNIYKYATRSE